MDLHPTTSASCDGSFGPSACSCASRFDFTLLFEQSILIIPTAAIFLVAMSIRLAKLWPESPKVSSSPKFLHPLKVAAYAALCSLQVTLVFLWSKSPLSTVASIPGASLNFIASLAICPLSYWEYTKSPKPSTTILLYLTASAIFDAVHSRTLWLISSTIVLPAISTASMAIKTILLLLESKEKQKFLIETWQHLGPESTSGILSRSFFWWLNDLMVRGFKTALSMSELFEIDDELRSEVLLARLKQSYEGHRSRRKYALLLATVAACRTFMLVTILPRICLIGFTFAQPMLLKRVITYVERNEGSDTASHSYGLIAATGLVFTGIALSTGIYQHYCYRTVTVIRGSLISLICAQILELSTFSTAVSAPLTLVSADVERICGSFEDLHEIWANPIQIVVAIWLLQRELGFGCIGPVIVITIAMVLMTRLANFMGPSQKSWNQGIQTRVSLTSEVLNYIKEVKMQGLESYCTTMIQGLRTGELQLSKKFRRLIVYMNLLGNTPAKIAPVLAFAIALAVPNRETKQSFSLSTVFTSLSIIGLLSGPMARLVFAVPSFASSLGCFERIQNFLEDSYTLAENNVEFHEDSPGASPSSHRGSLELCVVNSRRKAALIARNATFSTRAGNSAILVSINLAIEPAKLTAIIGAVGSGKSMLMQGFLGELCKKGFVTHFEEGVAYCAQSAWLTNSTIRENILGNSPMDVRWYETVVNACALSQDFQNIPAGDLALVGSKGSSLSGGQKQRVTLARAIYSKKSILFIDDILSGLDWKTQSHVWNNVFGPTGLLRQQQATIVLATHAVHLLDPGDQVIVLESCQIVYTGTAASLRQGKHSDNRLNKYHSNICAPGIGGITDVHERVQCDEAIPDSAEEYALQRRPGDASLYLYYLKSIGWRLAALAVVFGALVAFLGVFPQIWLDLWSNSITESATPNTGFYFGIYSFLAVISLLFMAIDIWFMFIVILPKSANILHLNLLQATMRAPLYFFTSTDTGDLINRFSQDMSLVDKDLPSALFTTSSNTFACIAEAGLILAGAKYLSAILPVVVFMLYCLQIFYVRTSQQIRLLDLQARAPLYSQLLETVDGLATIRAFRWQTTTQSSFLRLTDKSQRPYYLLFCIQRWLAVVLDLFVAAIAVLLVTFMVLLPQSTNVTATALALYNIIGFNSSLADLISSWTSLETSLGAISRLRDFETTTPTEQQTNYQTPPYLRWPVQGRLQIRNITASYKIGETPVLKDISLNIKAASKVAICGRTGSGKSSFILALLRLLHQESGVIELDGIDISTVAPDVLRSRLIVVPQEPGFLPGTLRCSLTSGSATTESKTPSDEQIEQALRKVELWEAVITRGNLDSDLSQLQLSKGQKQLLCLARAILQKQRGRLLILDEAMSAMDQRTEDVMVKVLEDEFAEHSIISVVHRLNTIRRFDQVVILEMGRVIEIGRPEDLRISKDTYFTALSVN